MIGALLAFTAEFFHETSSTLAKRMLARDGYSYYGFAAANALAGLGVFLLYAFATDAAFTFLPALVPLFVLRALFEIVQVELAFRALKLADRSTFAVLRTLTIPLLLLVDLLLGTDLSAATIAGIIIVSVALAVAGLDGKLDKRGAWYVVGSAVNAVVTIALFKYNIDHGNSVVAEQAMILLFIALVFGARSGFAKQERKAGLLTRPAFIGQSVTHGAALALSSFAFVFAPASVMITLMRSFSLFWSIVAGAAVFHERGVFHKVAIGSLLVVGLYFLGDGTLG